MISKLLCIFLLLQFIIVIYGCEYFDDAYTQMFMNSFAYSSKADCLHKSGKLDCITHSNKYNLDACLETCNSVGNVKCAGALEWTNECLTGCRSHDKMWNDEIQKYNVNY